MGRTTIAVAYAVALLMVTGCGGKVNAVPQRATSDGGSDAASSAAQGMGSGVAEVPDAQSDAALEVRSPPDGAAALTGWAACRTGAQCEVGRCKFQTLEVCGPGAMCCLDMLCMADAATTSIQASDYDQSCAADSDCVEVYVGNRCSCALSCQTYPAAINKGALPQFNADVSTLASAFCNCPPIDPSPVDTPCCVGGTCQFTSCSE